MMRSQEQRAAEHRRLSEDWGESFMRISEDHRVWIKKASSA